MSVVDGILNFNMSPVGDDKKWTSVFGINNFDVCSQSKVVGWFLSLRCIAHQRYLFGILPSQGRQGKQGQGDVHQSEGGLPQ